MRRALALLLVLAGCAAEEPAPDAPVPTPPPAEESREEVEPPPEPEAPPEAQPEETAVIVPDRPEGVVGCFPVSAPHRLAEGVGTAEVIAHEGGFAVALYVHAEGKERVEVHVGPAEGAPRLVESFFLDRATKAGRAVAPALASMDRGELMLAYVDRAGTVHARRAGKPRSDREIGARVDIRFPPALLGVEGGALLAFTAGDEVSHVYVVKLARSARAEARLDVTPIASGASAPSFVRGASEPTLAFVDARLGFSPIYTRTFGDALDAPIEPVLVRPLSHLLEPAQIAVAMHRELVHIGFTGRGVDMGSAIGWVREGKDAAVPASVVSPRGVGHLRVGVDVLPDGSLLFVGDAPLAREKGAAREVHLRTLDADRLGEAITLRGSDGTAARPALASLGDGKVAVVYSTGGAIELVHVDCGT